ncbi:aromatic amino acid lyase [Kineococcus radiotolerans]|uniref:Phenylalanine/histidine ammonia-lyase n=1 Tax=Kineococcus radiotolerans (strain ATCC BAA-149 / DSM 14245 / SRS30216) TaxID=266940 RepID=A6W7I4_KINRD|nr:aromatic amino acid lyase [Kineococcus radiotolerans]ABS02773.1 phenylalanine/histidine ammonia-lyase [Kineococcus radiotolerans SRS30216 = ATCC BAA-149]
MLLHRGPDLDRAAVLRVAAGERVELSAGLRRRLAGSRAAVLTALEGSGPVYGVSTGMGAMAGVDLDDAARARHQANLVVGRAVGSAPWLSEREVRAVLAVRLRTYLHPEAGVSPQLCERLVELLNARVHPQVPRRGNGAAGEIIPLAHVGAVVLGGSGTLDGRALPEFPFGPKEGVAFLEGVPVATALATLHVAAADLLLAQAELVLAASGEVLRASRDPVRAGAARGDDVLAAVLARLRERRPGGEVHGLQAPVSVRVGAAACALVHRRVHALAAAADRALEGVTDSPAFLDGRFGGTAGFAGTDLGADSDALAAALVHLAETGAARTHRMLDPARTGLPPQLSPEPGVQAGLVAVHKRAVGVVHRLRRFALPAGLGAVETSLGQEDVQSFALESAEGLAEVLAGLREVVAVELLAVHRARLLRGGLAGVSAELGALLDAVGAELGEDVADRPYGRDLGRLGALLEAGWGGAGA